MCKILDDFDENIKEEEETFAVFWSARLPVLGGGGGVEGVIYIPKSFDTFDNVTLCKYHRMFILIFRI